MKIRGQFGNIFIPKEKGQKIIAHVVNDYGVWGKNIIAVGLGKRWPTVRNHYMERFLNTESGLELGKVQFVPVGMDKIVANMVAQHGQTKGGDIYTDLKTLADCLEVVRYKARQCGASVAVHLGGLTSSEEALVVKLLSDTFTESPIDLVIYADTPAEHKKVTALLQELEPKVEESAAEPAAEAEAEDSAEPVEVEAPKVEAPKPEPAEVEASKVEAKKDEPKPEDAKVEESKQEKKDAKETKGEASGEVAAPPVPAPSAEPISPDVGAAASAGGTEETTKK